MQRFSKAGSARGNRLAPFEWIKRKVNCSHGYEAIPRCGKIHSTIVGKHIASAAENCQSKIIAKA
jgi:hypothetical protein